MASYSPRPTVSDGVITALAVAVIGAPAVLGPNLPYWIGAIMFYGGIGSAFLYAVWRWGRWLLGRRDDRENHAVDNQGGTYVGRDNSGPQTVIHGDVIIHPPTPAPSGPVGIKIIGGQGSFIGNKIKVGKMTGVSKGLEIEGGNVKDNEFDFGTIETQPKPKTPPDKK